MGGVRHVVGQLVAVGQVSSQRGGGVEDHHQRSGLELGHHLGAYRAHSTVGHRQHHNIGGGQGLVGGGDGDSGCFQTLNGFGIDLKVANVVGIGFSEVIGAAHAHFSTGTDQGKIFHVLNLNERRIERMNE